MVFGTQFLACLLLILAVQLQTLISGGNPEPENLLVLYQDVAKLFFDANGNIYTVLIGIMAAGITLFSQTGLRLSENRMIADAQFRYFDLMSFAFNALAAMLGALLVQASILDRWGEGVSAPTGTALVGCGVVWLVCCLLAPANFVVRISRTEQLDLYRERLASYRSALDKARELFGERRLDSGTVAVPIGALLVAGAAIGLTHLSAFRVDGGALPLSYIWIFVIVSVMIVSFGACLLLSRLLAEMKVSRLVNDTKNHFVNLAIFIFICTIVAFSVLFVILSVVISSATVGSAGAALVYMFIFGMFPATVYFLIGVRRIFFWRSVIRLISKSIELYQRGVDVRSELLESSARPVEGGGQGYL